MRPMPPADANRRRLAAVPHPQHHHQKGAIGRVALTKDRLAAGGHLRAADAALKEMLRRHPKLDEGGAMARRHKLLRAELASLG